MKTEIMSSRTSFGIPIFKECPACRSEKTRIQERSAVEKVFSFAIRLRKYKCLDCGKVFSAADRRRLDRNARGARLIERR